jgi:phosphotransferase system enzyme I (PtsI)
VDGEIARLHEALSLTEEQLDRQRQRMLEEVGERDAGIFAVHAMILQDPAALKTVTDTIREQYINVEGAIQALIDRLKKRMEGMQGESVRQYAADLSEPWRIVLNVLLRREQDALGATDHGVVLAASELTPEVVTLLPRTRILGIVTETGGRYSHGAVLARSLGLPCVVGLTNLIARLEKNLQVIVDGKLGTVHLRPDSEAVDAFLSQRQRREARELELKSHAHEPAITPDGHSVRIEVNLESILDLEGFQVESCDGVGLLRTEFLYMERSQFPSEEEQFRLYRRVLTALEGRPVTIRTLDIGGDKQLPYFKTPAEPNPALGWRGLRLTLEWRDLLQVQLRAVIRASAHGQVRLLLPMVSSLDEVRTVHQIFDRVRGQLVDQGYEVSDRIEVGVMIEVPSSVWIMDQLVEEVDFVSVGTNDLTQYMLAVDRDNPRVASLYEPYHPAVLRALDHVARTAREGRISCSVCGDMAGDYAMAVALVGMGYHALSAARIFLPELRFALRQTTLADAKVLADRIIKAEGPAEVRAALDGVRAKLHAGLGEESPSAPLADGD